MSDCRHLGACRYVGIVRGLVGDPDRLPAFLPDGTGHRPIWGSSALFQEDSAWRDELLFHEYFHGETGEGLGASHQTGWTALVAALVAERGRRVHGRQELR